MARIALALLVVGSLSGFAPAVRQSAAQDDVRSKIADAAALIARRAFVDALKILEPLAVNPVVVADTSLAADVAYHTGNAYLNQNNYAKALDFFERSRALNRGRADRTFEARVLQRLATTYKSLGQYATAQQTGRDAVTAAESTKDAGLTARAWMILGGIQDLMGRYSTALESYRTAERSFAGAKTPDAVLLLNEMAITEKNLGNFDAAMDLYSRSIEGQRALGNPLGQAIALMNRANVYKVLGQDERAVEGYLASLTIARELNERRGISIILSNLGDLLLSRGETDRALAMFQEMLEITLALGNRNEQATAILNIADVHRARGELDDAVRRYDEAIGIQRAVGARVRMTQSLIHLAEARLKQSNAAAAAAVSTEALTIARESAAPEFEWRALHIGAQSARALGQKDVAISKLRASTAIINDLRANVSTDTSKVGFVDGRQEAFHDLASLLVETGRSEEALEAAEAGRARAFADLLAQRKVQGKPAEQQRLAELRTTLDEARAAAGTTSESGRKSGALDAGLASLKSEHGELASLLTAESPKPAEIRSIVGRLNATVVEYLVAERELLIWAIAPDGVVHAAKIDIAGPKLQTLVSEVRTLIGAGGTAPAPPRLAVLARELDGLLIAPVARWLPTSPDDVVIVVPHGPLALLPFAALQDVRGRLLVERHTLASAPSIAVYRYTSQKRHAGPRGAGSALVLADAAGPSEAAMPPLPGAREEGTLVARRLASADARLLVGAEARESTFKRAAVDQRIIHLATHGLISSDRPLTSSLLLGPGDGEDGYLRVDEIFGLPLNADLVVLSGCSTGLGQPSGDGIIGLGRAFIYAGTPVVVVSQWDVNDRATAFLMDQFYSSLRGGRGPASALRAAQLATRARYPQPYLWAAFVAIGEPR
jgi:CHAT domain-containing protein